MVPVVREGVRVPCTEERGRGAIRVMIAAQSGIHVSLSLYHMEVRADVHARCHP